MSHALCSSALVAIFEYAANAAETPESSVAKATGKAIKAKWRICILSDIEKLKRRIFISL